MNGLIYFILKLNGIQCLLVAHGKDIKAFIW